MNQDNEVLLTIQEPDSAFIAVASAQSRHAKGDRIGLARDEQGHAYLAIVTRSAEGVSSVFYRCQNSGIVIGRHSARFDGNIRLRGLSNLREPIMILEQASP